MKRGKRAARRAQRARSARRSGRHLRRRVKARAPVRRVRRRNATARTASQRRDRERAYAVLSDMRRLGKSLDEAARARETSAETVHPYIRSVLRGRKGKERATPFDRLPRTLNVLTRRGYVTVTVRDSRTATRIAEHANAIKQGALDLDWRAAARFAGQSFRAGGKTYHFVTDPTLLTNLYDASLLRIDALYRAPGASR